MFKKALAASRMGRDFGQPNRGFHRFNLAKERTKTIELVLSPMLQQAACLRCDLPLVEILQRSPVIDVLPNLINI